MEHKWKKFVLPAVLVVAALAHDLIAWQPHGDAGLLSSLVSLAVCIYAVVMALGKHPAEDWRRFIAYVVLLVLALVVLWVSGMIPFCPECDGGIDAPLMRWIFAEWL